MDNRHDRVLRISGQAMTPAILLSDLRAMPLHRRVNVVIERHKVAEMHDRLLEEVLAEQMAKVME